MLFQVSARPVADIGPRTRGFRTVLLMLLLGFIEAALASSEVNFSGVFLL